VGVPVNPKSCFERPALSSALKTKKGKKESGKKLGTEKKKKKKIRFLKRTTLLGAFLHQTFFQSVQTDLRQRGKKKEKKKVENSPAKKGKISNGIRGRLNKKEKKIPGGRGPREDRLTKK